MQTDTATRAENLIHDYRLAKAAARGHATSLVERDAAQRELEAYKQATEEFCRGGSEAAFLIIERARELLAASA